MARRTSRSDSDAEHFGPDDPEFFHEPPSEIGELLSMHTSLSENIDPPSLVYRLVRAGLVAGSIELVMGIGLVVVIVFGRQADWGVFACLFLFLSTVNLALVFALSMFTSGFNHYCGYVGKDGAAYFSCSRSRDNLVDDKLLLFKEARDLRVATTHHFLNDAYTQTTFSYVWTDDDDREVFSIAGAHQALYDHPEQSHVYIFALETEEAWSKFLLKQIGRKLKKGGSHKFRLSGSNYILLRSDSLKLSLHGNTQEFDEEDLDEIEIANGEISLKEPGSKKGWFTDTGIHVFSFAELSNARVFLLLLNTMFGIPIN